MPKEKKKSWFRRHKILTGILGFFGFIMIIGILQNAIEYAEIGYSNYNEDGSTSINSTLLVPQDEEVDRIWKIGNITSITINASGFIDGSQRSISQSESFGGTSILTKAYLFDSIENANLFYNQQKEEINIRGVEEWSIGTDCFGIEQESFLSGAVTGLCWRSNIVFYVRSSSTSYDYASNGKEFIKIMLKKV
jgi:hypothetical protein